MEEKFEQKPRKAENGEYKKKHKAKKTWLFDVMRAASKQ